MENNIVILVGPSGSGKTTAANYLADHYGMRPIDSYTTRKPRYTGELGHTFITDEQFDWLEDLVAYTEFDGHRYAATKHQVDTCDTYVIDVDGAEALHDLYDGEKEIFVVYLNVPMAICRNRMFARGDGGLESAQRIAHDQEAFAGAIEKLTRLYGQDHVLVLGELCVPVIAEKIAKFAGRI